MSRIPSHTIADAPQASRPLFTAYFLNYAQTAMDLPGGPE